jgi:hypothetical protein
LHFKFSLFRTPIKLNQVLSGAEKFGRFGTRLEDSRA